MITVVNLPLRLRQAAHDVQQDGTVLRSVAIAILGAVATAWALGKGGRS